MAYRVNPSRPDRLADWLLHWGDRVFTHDSWHRVAYQPVLFFFLWGAAVRLCFTRESHPSQISGILSDQSETIWLGLSMICPPMALLSWWLILKARFQMAALIGLWMRLAADLGQLTALLVYHVATIQFAVMRDAEVQVVFRYITGATCVFVFLLVVRDIWAITATERVASMLRDEAGRE